MLSQFTISFFITVTLSNFSYFVHKLAAGEMSRSYTSKHIIDKVPVLHFQKLREMSKKKQMDTITQISVLEIV